MATGTLDEFFMVESDNDLLCNTCNRSFCTTVKTNAHVCKGTKSKNDLVSVALRYAWKLIEDGKVDFIDTRQRGGVSGTCRNTVEEQLLDQFNSNLHDYVDVDFPNGWALRAGHGKSQASDKPAIG